jgi:hypothetical protein
VSINIGDNFKYLGKKFLDDRESFNTLAEMIQCTDVPEGFVTFCKEDGKRYEYSEKVDFDPVTGNWREFKVGTDINEEVVENIVNNKVENYVDTKVENIVNNKVENYVDTKVEDYVDNYFDEHLGDIINNLDHDCTFVGEEEPEDDTQIWFDPTSEEDASEGVQYDNPIIDELFACIRTLQDQVAKLQADVEYIKINGGGIPPVEPPGGGTTSQDSLILEDGGFFLLEDGSFMLLESAVETIGQSLMLLENGAQLLLENGANMILE